MPGAYRGVGRMEDANRALDEVLRIEPENAYALSKKAELLIVENKLQEAESLLAPIVTGAGEIYPGIAATWGQLMLSIDEPQRAIEVVREASEDNTEGEQGRVWPMFLLAKLLEKAKRYDEAFEAYTNANRLKHMPHSAPSPLEGYPDDARRMDTRTRSTPPARGRRIGSACVYRPDAPLGYESRRADPKYPRRGCRRGRTGIHPEGGLGCDVATRGRGDRSDVGAADLDAERGRQPFVAGALGAAGGGGRRHDRPNGSPTRTRSTSSTSA